MKPFKYAVGLVLAITAWLAHAAPVDSAAQGYAGFNVTVKLNDPSTLVLIGSTIGFTFDPTFLTYVSGGPGSIVPAPSFVSGVDLADVNATLGSGVASLAYPNPVADGANGSLLELVFLIKASADPGDTSVIDFICDPFGVGSCDYDFTVKATVTVLERATTPIPLPGTLPLLGLAVAALWWARRRMH